MLALALVSLAACGGDDPADSASVVTEVTEPAETAPTATESPATEAPAESMRAKRYCEILLLAPFEGGIRATVFNTFPLNDCPDGAWRAIDTVQVAEEQGAVFALANGPRYWLMDAVGRDTSDVVSETFGELEMNRYATVDITDPSTVGRPYTPQRVDRKATFVFHAGGSVFQLVADDGRRFVMQSWSQQVDPTLDESGLAVLGARLQLPAGWTYEVVELDTDLVVGADRAVAEVLQDELLNSYSRIA